jgi:hypothetical protein
MPVPRFLRPQDVPGSSLAVDEPPATPGTTHAAAGIEHGIFRSHGQKPARPRALALRRVPGAGPNGAARVAWSMLLQPSGVR